jgi:adenosylmethionine-8-amino-7-oxononanoate aminotransferase
MFAYEQLRLQPDLLCLGKSITGGALALSATMASEPISEAFLGSHDQSKQFFHGHSYAGNPIACAAAAANLDLFERERSLENVTALAPALLIRLQALQTVPAVKNVRGSGLMFGIELNPDAIDWAGARSAGWAIADALFERGYFTRPIGDVIQFVPPLSLTDAEGTGFCTSLEEILKP